MGVMRLASLLAVGLLGCAGTRADIWADAGRPGDGALTFPDGLRLDLLADDLFLPTDSTLPTDLPPPDTRPPPDTGPPQCPGACVDGDPCTSDTCVNGTCVNDKIGQAIQRFYNPATGAHAYAAPGNGPAGFQGEALVFRTLVLGVPGSSPVYQQYRGATGDYMLSLSSTEGVSCCGYVSNGSIGHGFASAGSGTVPLYRLYHAASGLHLSSTSSTEGTGGGYVLEGVTVHVCPL